MSEMFKKDGTLNIPICKKISLPKEQVSKRRGRLVLNEAYCAQGHSLISDRKIGNRKGIHLIYRDQAGERESEIVISSTIGDSKKVFLRGKPFRKGETVKAFCPTCLEELPILFDCECGAHIYIIYIDRRLDNNYGQSFCSRVGCVQASRLRFSEDMLREFIQEYCL